MSSSRPTPQQEIKIESGNPNIREFYNKYNLDYVPTAEDRVHAIFDQQTDGQHEIKIHGIYRSRKGSFKSQEKLFWFEVINSHDRFGNPIQKRYIVGRYDKPIPEFRYDEKLQGPRCTGVRKYEEVYDVPFDVKLLDKLVDEEKIDDNTKFYLEAFDRKYAVTSFDDFRNLLYDDLAYFVRTGLRPEQREENLKRKERQRTGQE